MLKTYEIGNKKLTKKKLKSLFLTERFSSVNLKPAFPTTDFLCHTESISLNQDRYLYSQINNFIVQRLSLIKYRIISKSSTLLHISIIIQNNFLNNINVPNQITKWDFCMSTELNQKSLFRHILIHFCKGTWSQIYLLMQYVVKII